jgi:hypothetical protein
MDSSLIDPGTAPREVATGFQKHNNMRSLNVAYRYPKMKKRRVLYHKLSKAAERFITKRSIAPEHFNN